jgi:hypothetical protein
MTLTGTSRPAAAAAAIIPSLRIILPPAAGVFRNLSGRASRFPQTGVDFQATSPEFGGLVQYAGSCEPNLLSQVFKLLDRIQQSHQIAGDMRQSGPWAPEDTNSLCHRYTPPCTGGLIGKKRAEAPRKGGRGAPVPRPAACHSSALQICPTISHQPTSAKVRPKLRATISAIR